jgi:uncharacterized protein (DUF58 family)
VTRTAAPKLVRMAGLAALALFAGLVTGQVELVLLGVPFIVALALGVAVSGAVDIEAAVQAAPRRVFEGDELTVTVEVESARRVSELEVGLAVPAGLEPRDPTRRAVSLVPDEPRELELRLGAEHLGGYRLGLVALRAHAPGRLVVFEDVRDLAVPVKVFPRLERRPSGVRPPTMRVLSGSYVSRALGDGIEFAGVRAYASGDSARRINWRVTSRRGALHVNVHQPERNADLVIFLDAFGHVGEPGRSSLDSSVRGAATLARHMLREKDRVGFVAFGGTVGWLAAGMGDVQLYRLVDALLDVNVSLSYAWKAIDVLPRRALPPSALVIAFSPLADERAVAAFEDLAARGYDLVVVDTMPEQVIAAGPGAAGRAAHRMWRLAREDLRAELGNLGVPVLPLGPDEELADALALLPRRRGRRARVPA